MRSRASLALLVAVSACSCGTEPAPEAQVRVPAPLPGLRGRIVVGPSGAMPPGAVVEVRVIPERAMIPHVAARLGEAREELRRISAERDRARADAEAALAATDQADQEWKRTMASDLRRRVEVSLRRSSDPSSVEALHADLLARKQASYRRAVAAGKRSLEKEHAVAALERAVGRYRDARFYLRDLPPAVEVTHPDASGSFAMDVPPGRYALVAWVDAAPDPAPDASAPGPAWLLWVEVRADAMEPLVLDARNQHGNDCDACVLGRRDLP